MPLRGRLTQGRVKIWTPDNEPFLAPLPGRSTQKSTYQVPITYPHLLANFFKRSNYDEPIASEFCALDYLYEVFHEIRKSEKCDELLYEVIHDRSLNKKHDCNDFIINSIYLNCANNMQNPKLGDASFAMSSTCWNDHDWGNSSYDLENLFKPHDEYDIDNSVCNIIESGLSLNSW